MNKVIKDRLTKPRKLTAVTIRIPADVTDSFSESERLAFELRQLGVDDKILKQALERLM